MNWKTIEKQNKEWYKLYRWLLDKVFFYHQKETFFRDIIREKIWYKINVNIISDKNEVVISKWKEKQEFTNDYERLELEIVDLKDFKKIKQIINKHIESLTT